MTPNPFTGPVPRSALNARLAAAYAMPGGAAREQAITDLVLAAIVAEIASRAPSVRSVEFDWAPYGGLHIVAFRGEDGAEVHDEDLAVDLIPWASDLRSPDLAGMTRASGDGPFHLDLHTIPEPARAPFESSR
ncbi:hypothetical protein [Nocardia wallacei]|uniref:hypothetical protein n=1 Tax=Nocardia wallacei TaxID=480035 RepID=UPI002458AE10|nr:hypothetical protein [Nocardia wallacei]